MAGTDQNDAARAAAEAHEAEKKAQEAREKAERDERTAAEKRADKAEQEADDARARAAEAQAGEPDGGLKTVGEAGVVAPHVAADTPAGDVMAVKRGNDPANPQPLPGIPADYDGPTVRLTRTTPDKPGEVVTTDVHPDMEGDYLRAGWSRG